MLYLLMHLPEWGCQHVVFTNALTRVGLLTCCIWQSKVVLLQRLLELSAPHPEIG